MTFPLLAKIRTTSTQVRTTGIQIYSSFRKFAYATHHESFREQLLNYRGGSVDLQKQEDTGIAFLKFNNPSTKNALSGKMMVDLADAIEELDSWKEGKGLLVYGSDQTFCSGGDLNTVKNICDSETGYKMSKFMHTTLTKMFNLPLISAALIQGSALGGGAEITTACDFRLMTSQAKLGFVQIKMGVVTGWGGGTRLVNLLGRTDALKILCSGTIMDAQECKRIGFVDEIFPEGDESFAVASQWLGQYCRKEAQLIRTMKSIVSIADGETSEISLEKERRSFSQVWGGEHQMDALNKNIKHNK